MGKYQIKLPAKKYQNGFTIIEVLLFTSLTGLFLLIAVLGSGPIQRNTQFTVAMEDLEQSIDDVISDLRNGVSNNPGNNICGVVDQNGNNVNEPGSNEDCVLIGKLIKFGEPGSSDFTVYDVIANRWEDGDEVSLVISDDINQTNLNIRAVEAGAVTEQYQWGVKFKGSLAIPSIADDGVKMIGFYFDPAYSNNSVIVPVVYDTNDQQQANNISDDNKGSQVTPTLCFSYPGDNRNAALIFSSNNRGLSSELEYDPDYCEGSLS